MMPHLGALILAAGQSTRMGAPKALLPLGEQSMLAQCTALFRECGIGEIVVVTGCHAVAVGVAAAAAGARVVHNPMYALGMYGSIRAGVRFLAGRCDGFFLLPVDIPLLRRGTVILLARAFAADPLRIYHPVFAGRRGHPPLLPAGLIAPILEREHRDEGLRGLLREVEQIHPHLVQDVDVADAHIHIDLNTPESYRDGCLRFARRGVPNMAECEVIFTRLHPMSATGLAHGRAVAEVAAAIAETVNRHSGRSLDVELCRAGGWLHDLAKESLHPEREGEFRLRELGFDRAGAIVGGLRDLPWDASLVVGEREIVHLADTLIRGSELVTVRERFEEKMLIYRKDPATVRAIDRQLEQAERLAAAVEAAAGRPLAEITRKAAGVSRL